jgi:hypothetical protein
LSIAFDNFEDYFKHLHVLDAKQKCYWRKENKCEYDDNVINLTSNSYDERVNKKWKGKEKNSDGIHSKKQAIGGIKVTRQKTIETVVIVTSIPLS